VKYNNTQYRDKLEILDLIDPDGKDRRDLIPDPVVSPSVREVEEKKNHRGI